MSARTSFFILMVASSVSTSAPSPSPSFPSGASFSLPRLFVSLLSPFGDSTVAPFIHGPVLVPRSSPRRSSYPRCAAAAASSSSSYFCRLDSFLLSRRERLNSLRPLFAPTLLSSSLDFLRLPRGYLAATDRRRNRGDRDARFAFGIEPFERDSHATTENVKSERETIT